MKKSKKIYIIAGEDSGDNLGAKLISQIKNLSTEPVEFFGVGGRKMQEQGLQSIFPMKEISIIGWLEILPHIFNLLRRLKQTFNHIKQIQPDCIITIDAPGFNKKIAKKICEELPDIKRMHYVAPTVWAYKPQRAKTMAELFNHLLVLLPFEPKYFEAENLPTTYTGHPIFEDFIEFSEQEKLKVKDELFENGKKIIALLVGSRAGEVKRLMPIYIDAIKLLNKHDNNLQFALLVTPNFADEIKNKTKELNNVKVIVEDDLKKKILQIADAAIVKSGTVTLEVAASKCPMVVTYKVSNFSAKMLRKMILIKYVTLVNIIEDKQIIPELLQEDCTAENISKELINLLNNKNISEAQINQSQAAIIKMGYGQLKPASKIAAETVLSLIN